MGKVGGHMALAMGNHDVESPHQSGSRGFGHMDKTYRQAI